MSIADRISSMASNLSSAYGRIAYLGVDTSSIDKNMQNLSTVLDTVYNDYPKVSDEGISPSLSGTKVGRLSSTLKGNTSQDGTPTPNSSVNINVVKGTNSITVSDGDSESETYPIILPVQNLLPTDENAWEQGTINNTTGNNQNNTTRIRTIDYYPIKNDTDYYISVQDTTCCFVNIMLYDSSKNFIESYYNIASSISGATSLKINIPSSAAPDVKYMRAMLRTATSDTILPSAVSTIKPMIELGDKANRYTPYGVAPIELCKIGDYQDYIYRENGNWFLYKAISKVTYSGASSESWSFASTAKGYYIAPSGILAGSNTSTTKSPVICNYFTQVVRNDMNTEGLVSNGIATSVNSNITIKHEDYTSSSELNDFKTWLSTHNVIVYYVLSTPTTTQITDTTLVSQLNALYNAMSYNGQTNILQTNADNPFIIYASALKGG